jgi:hypothetical protein
MVHTNGGSRKVVREGDLERKMAQEGKAANTNVRR